MEINGATCNVSVITNEDGQVELGLHYTNTDGKDISVETTGDSLTDAVLSAYDAILNEALPAADEDDEDLLSQENEELEEKVQSLEDRIDYYTEAYYKSREEYWELVRDYNNLKNLFDDLCEENDLLWDEIDSQEEHECFCRETTPDTPAQWMNTLDKIETMLDRLGW